MINLVLLSMVMCISLYQLISRLRKRYNFDLFPFMVATCCLIIGKFPSTEFGMFFSITTCCVYLIYLSYAFVILPIRKYRQKFIKDD